MMQFISWRSYAKPCQKVPIPISRCSGNRGDTVNDIQNKAIAVTHEESPVNVVIENKREFQSLIANLVLEANRRRGENQVWEL